MSVVVIGAIMTSVVGWKIVLAMIVSSNGLLASDGLGDRVFVCDILGGVFVCCVRS